jgi:hypothetical protein
LERRKHKREGTSEREKRSARQWGEKVFESRCSDELLDQIDVYLIELSP